LIHRKREKEKNESEYHNRSEREQSNFSRCACVLFFELVAGARRYRASKLAKRGTIPATVRELTDTECLELQLVELSVVRKSFLRSREA
jgi:ParB/Sulfiredoxin domain